MEFQNGLLNKEKDKLNNEGQNLDFDSQIKNLIIFSLYYSNPNIMINTFCFNKNHKNTIPLKEFLIKYHPFYNKYKKFNFCDKCMLKLLYSKKLNFTFYTNYCIKCDKHFCAHSINHVHDERYALLSNVVRNCSLLDNSDNILFLILINLSSLLFGFEFFDNLSILSVNSVI